MLWVLYVHDDGVVSVGQVEVLGRALNVVCFCRGAAQLADQRVRGAHHRVLRDSVPGKRIEPCDSTVDYAAVHLIAGDDEQLEQLEVDEYRR